MITPFTPYPNQSQLITTSGSSANVNVGKDAPVVHIKNYGATNPAYVRLGNGSGTTATSADLVIGPGEAINLYKGSDKDTVAALQLTGATTLQVTPGSGGV